METPLAMTRSSRTAGAFQGTFGGKTDAWVAKLNSSGTKLIYATFLGGSGDERTGGIAVDSSGNAYVTGTTTSKNFPVTAGVFQGECKLKNDGSLRQRVRDQAECRWDHEPYIPHISAAMAPKAAKALR